MRTFFASSLFHVLLPLFLLCLYPPLYPPLFPCFPPSYLASSRLLSRPFPSIHIIPFSYLCFSPSLASFSSSYCLVYSHILLFIPLSFPFLSSPCRRSPTPFFFHISGSGPFFLPVCSHHSHSLALPRSFLLLSPLLGCVSCLLMDTP